jgi:zinc protease
MVKKFQLKNGMKVLLQESHKSPVVSVQVWVRTGSADEAKGEEGISHFIEHLVFKGTRKFKVGEIASMIEGAGGELNAYTSFDQTVFYVTISKQFVQTGLEALADMMGFPKFDPTEIDNEREVVVEEIKRGQDSLGRNASQLLFSTVYQKHPYGIPVIGYEKNVRGWSAKKIENYYHSRYAPKNMFLVISGDFESANMKQQVQKFFGEFKSYKVKSIKRKKEPIQKTPRIKVQKSTFEQSISYLSFKTPNIKNKDVPALDVLAMILGQGDSSRLVHKLRIEAPIVNSVGASLFTGRDPGFLAFSIGYNKENLLPAIRGISETVQEILSGEIRDEEIRKAIINLESENFYAMETVDGLSRKLGDAEFLMGDPKYFEKYLQEVSKVTAQDILRVAKKYITPSTLSIATVTNDEPAAVKKVWQKWEKDFRKILKSVKTSKVSNKKVAPAVHKTLTKKNQPAPEVKAITLSNGVRILTRPNFETDVFSVKLAFLGGARAENPELAGLSELAARSWMGGTKTRAEAQIYHEIEAMAAGIGPLSGRNSFGLGLDALSTFEEPARELFLELLTEPTFPAEVIEREKKIQLDQIRSRNDNASQIAIRQLMESLFRGHPYSYDMLGTPESLAKIGHKEIQAYWDKLHQRKNLTFVLSGAFDQDSWLKKIEEATNKMKEGKKFEAKFPLQFPKTEEHKFYQIKKEQSHLIIAYPGVTITDEDRFTLQVIQSILAGQGGRLFIELRDKNSLAYSVSPMRMEGIDAGYFGAYIGCSPSKVKKALEMMKVEFQKLCDTKVPQAELERAQRYLAGRHDIDLQRVSSIAASILYDDIYGVPYNETFTLADKYFSITSADIMRVAKMIFQKTPVVSLAGPENPIDKL